MSPQQTKLNHNLTTALIIAGPTASGKSALALDIADQYPATLVNADSQQVYKQLSVLSARPDAAEMARAPHRLFGVLDGSEVCSAGRWLELAKPEIETALREGRLPLLVGGTGLYLKALTEGLSPIPDISPAVRSDARALWRETSPEAFIERLAQLDPESAARLHQSDSQRLIRAYEVSLETGRPFSQWRNEPKIPVMGHVRFATVQLLPDRELLYARINARFDEMMERGALDEVRELMKLGLDADLPVMKAVGVPELMAHLNGEMTLEAAVELAKTASRQYAKRQLTWARHQQSGETLNIEQYSESSKAEIFAFINQFLLTANP